MKKILSYLLFMFITCLSFTTVYAKEYLKDEVDASLTKIVDTWISTAPEGTTFSSSSTDTETILTSVIGGRTYRTRFTYEDGIFKFASDQSLVSTEEEFIRGVFDNFNISFFLAAVLSMYDEETVESVADVVVGDTDNIDTFTVEKDGFSASLIPTTVDSVKINGSEVKAMGFIKTMEIDVNHKGFIKWVTDNDGSLILGSSSSNPVDNSKDIVTFEVIINGGNPIEKNTPLDEIPVVIKEILRDGTIVEKKSTIANLEYDYGYVIEDFSIDKTGDFTATIISKNINSDGTVPSSTSAKYTIVARNGTSELPITPPPENPKTGIVTHTLIVVITLSISILGIVLLRKKNILRKI